MILTGLQSALQPRGEHAEQIARLWDLFLVVCAVVWLLVMIALALALLRRRAVPILGNTAGAVKAVAAATGVTVLILFGLLISSIFTARGIAYVPESAVQVVITGRQWWWQIDYEHPDHSKKITTANELTIPVGMPVHVTLRSSDVIHSFWVPNLHGKQDLIPGYTNAILLQAKRAGVWRGQCAEFCGLQHAKMGLWVNALPPEEFAAWAESERLPSRIPSTPEQRKGQEVFMRSPCPLCHTIQGTGASGKTGPDLTHFASRRSIGAATLPNRRGYLAGWILDTQHVKPGAQMPSIQLDQGDLEPLLAYLESLR
jgi:cytochrome c oxidase subunit 2